MNDNEQMRADVLSQQLDGLLSGEAVSGDEPLLSVAQTFIENTSTAVHRSDNTV